MHIFRCCLTLHDPLFFATREIGRLYETGRYLHNYALTYALGLATSSYFCADHVPRYGEELAPLNERGIYVTPAAPVDIAFSLATLKYGEEQTHMQMTPGTKNTPSFGKLKELAPESTFQFFVLSANPLVLPRWIRLGKWMSKALLEHTSVEAQERGGVFTAECPLNPLDLPAGAAEQLQSCDIISMPPASLIANVRMIGSYFALSSDRGIPIGLAYAAPAEVAERKPRGRKPKGASS